MAALQFIGLDIPNIPTVHQTLTNANLFSKQNVNQMRVFKEIIQYILALPMVADNLKELLVSRYLNEQNNLQSYFSAYLEFKDYINQDAFFQTFKRHYANSSSRELQDFVNLNLTQILENQNIYGLFEKQIQTLLIAQYSKGNVQCSSVLQNSPAILSVDFIKKLSISNNQHIQEKLQSQLLFISIDQYRDQYKRQDLEEIIMNILQKQIDQFSSLEQIVTDSPILYEFATQKPFSQLKGYSTQAIFDKINQRIQQRIQAFFTKDIFQSIRSVFRNKIENPYNIQPVLVRGIVLNLTANLQNPEPKVLTNLFNQITEAERELISPSLQPIVVFILQKIYQIDRINEFNNVVGNPLLMNILRLKIELLNEDGENLLNEVIAICSSFLENVNQLSITIQEYEQQIKYHKDKLYEVADLIGFEFSDPGMFQSIEETGELFNNNLKKYRVFNNYMMKTESYVDYSEFSEQIDLKDKQFTSLPVRKIREKEFWEFFDNYQTFDLFFMFQHSKVFESVFNKCKKQLAQASKQKEEQKEEIKEDDQVDTNILPASEKLTSQEFDIFCLNTVFKGKLSQIMAPILQYPEGTGLNRSFLKKYFGNIKSSNIRSELNILAKGHSILSGQENVQFNRQLIEDLNYFIDIEEYLEKAKTIQNIVEFIPERVRPGLEDSHYLQLSEFIKLNQDMTNETQLADIRNQIMQVSSIITEIEGNEIDLPKIAEFANSRKTYNFALENQGANYNDLYEMMEDQQFINIATINDMNSISKLFIKIKDRLDKFTEFDDLVSGFVQIFRVIMNILNEDNQSTVKLDSCNKNLQSFVHLTTAQLKTTENTMQIINGILEAGMLAWKINDQGKCDFSITINREQFTEVLDKDKIDIHRKRGLISAAGKKVDLVQEEKNKQQAILFNDIFRLADAIQAPFEELTMIGYYDFNKEDKLIEQECNEKILDILESIRNNLQDQLKEWKQLLTKLKKDFYIITFVPNNKLHKVLEFFQTHDRQAYLECLPIFQYIYYEITEEQIYSQRLQTDVEQSVYEQLNDLGALMTKVFTKDEQGQEVGLTSEHKIPAEYLIGDQSSKLKKGRVQFIYVQDDTQLCQSILALYSYTKFYPNASEVLFCNSEKKQLELENFVLRAMGASSFYKRPKLYVIANFQALEFIVQLKAYQFIMEQQKENSDFQLFVITQCADIKQVHIVEELRSSTLFKGILKDSACLELLKPFHQRICCVTSQSSGYGKSTYIKDKIDTEIQARYVRIPIYGVMDRLKLSNYHQLKLKDITDNNYAIHYDLYPITGESINILMFELIVLKCINNESQGILHFPRNINIFIEVAQSLNSNFYINSRDQQKIFLTYLRRVELEWDPRNIKVTLDGKDKYQRVAKYANEIITNGKSKAYNQKLLFDDKFTNPINLVQDQIIDYFRREVKSNPNFYLLNSFIAFVTDQLKMLQESSFFMQECLEDTFGNLGQPFFKTVVDSLMEFSLKLSKNEASLEKQRTNMSNQSEEEEMVNRYKDLNWSNNNTLLITINQTGTVCPIYKFVDHLPLMLRDLHKNFPQAMPEYKDFLNMDQLDFYKKIYELIITSDNQNANPLIFKEELPYNASRSQKESYKEREQQFYRQQIRELNLDKIVFTRDNFLKLVLIYIRLRANLPVIVMGETGVGKTAIISYLAERLNANFKHFNIHAGITENQIIKYTNTSKEEAMNDIDEIFEGIDLTEDQKIQLIECPDLITKELKIQIADQHYREAKQLMIGEESKEELTEWQKINYADRKISNLRLTIIFYDEINTNECISGLLKEIVIDKYLQGKKLPPNLRVIAACNPYKLKTVSQHTISSGYNKPYQDNQKVSRLVYTVHPLPESMMSFIWDFGSLSKEEEESYITKLIEKENSGQSEQGYTKDEIRYISQCVCKSQVYIRNEEFAWSVSLRDAARFSQLLGYFYKPSMNREYRHESTLNREKKKSLALSLAFCYMYRITSTKGRRKYRDMISNISTIYARYLELHPFDFTQIINEEQSKYLDYMEIPQGIGKNTPLKENVFVMITCIMNQIPLIITGKPGSSKTLAMNLVTKSMKGTQSSNNFFSSMPAVLQFTYQGSVQSTSRGIERIFEKAIKCQDGFKNNDDVLALVIIDEIGLAEISPYNPLKVLHSLLEPPKVPFVAVSNWNLDASKMNRAITLCRPDPDPHDLKESIESISQEININDQQKHQAFRGLFLESLVNTYLDYLQYQEKECKEGQNFHGLRDFYALTQFIASNIAPLQPTSYNKGQVVFQGLLRNFGGKSFEKIFEIAENRNLLEFQTKRRLRDVSTIDLIKDNIEDKNVRHMMVITDNQQTAIQYVEDICKDKQKEYQIYSGSDFQEDKTEQAAYKLIYDIILRMEKGTIVILQNLESIYQSFYDMLNQNYQIIGSQRFCKVAIGADSTRCNVNENFKCILVCHETQVQKMDAPLLNRFEKQRLLEAQTLDDIDNQRIEQLKQWIKYISQPPNTQFNRTFMFPTLNFSDLNYLVSQTKSIFEQTNNDDYCKQIIIQLANYSGIIRSQLIHDEYLLDIYDQDGIHSKFEELIFQLQTRTDQYNNKFEQKFSQFCDVPLMVTEDEESKQDPDNDQEMSLADSQKTKPKTSQEQILRVIQDLTYEYKNDEQVNRFSFFDVKEKGLFTGFNIIVHTYQLYLGDLKLNDQHEQLVLSNINSRKMFEETIHEFFFKSPSSILIIISDSQIDSKDRISLCRNIINEQRMRYYQEFKGMKSVVIVIRQNERHQLQFNFAQGWRQIFIDVLNGFGDTKTLECKKLLSYSLEQIFNDKEMLQELVQMSCNAAVSQLQYNQDEEELQSQLKLIRRLACNDEETIDLIRDLILFNINTKKELFIDTSENWQLEQVCLNKVLMGKTYSFQIAAIMFLTEVVQKNLAFIFFHMQNSGLLQTLDEDIKSFGTKYFRTIYKIDYYKTPLQDKYIVTDLSKLSRYPYCQDIHDKVMEQNSLIDAELIEKRNLLRNEAYPTEELFQETPPLIREDMALQESIKNLTTKCEVIFVDTFMSEYKVINLNTPRYIENFSFLIAPANQNKIYHIFLADILYIITPSYENLIELYTVHNKYEDFINKTYAMIQKINYEYSEFMSLLKSIIDHERQDQTEIKYLSRSIIVKCLGKALFKLYFPTWENVQRLPNWADKAKSIYEIYEMMAEVYIQEELNLDSKRISFLIDFNHKVLKPLGYSEEQLIEIAQTLENDFNINDVIHDLRIQEAKQIELCEDQETKREVKKQYSRFIYDTIYSYFKNWIQVEQQNEFLILTLKILEQDFTNYRNSNDDYLMEHLMKVVKIIAEILDLDEESQEVLQDFEGEFNQDNKSELISIIQDFIAESKIDSEHPLMIALCDAFQAHNYQIDYNDEEFEFESAEEILKQAMDRIVQTNLTLLDRLRSVALFKSHVYLMTTQIINSKLYNDPITCKQIIDSMNVEFVQQQETHLPLLSFVVKQLQNSLSLDQIMYGVQSLLPSIKYLQIPDQKYKQYPITFDKELKQTTKQFLLQQRSQDLEEILQHNSPQPQLTLTEYLYLNDKDGKLDYLNLILNSRLSLNQKEFFKSIFSFNPNSQINEFYSPSQNPIIRKFQTIWSYTQIVASTQPESSFLGAVLKNPNCLENYFVPFQVNVPEDPEYYKQIFIQDVGANAANQNLVTRYKCRQCEKKFCIPDCGALNHSRPFTVVNKVTGQAETRQLGAGQCAKCGANIGYGAQDNSIFIDQKAKNDFNTEPESERGYIFIGSEDLEEMQIRSLSELNSRLGGLIISSLIICSIIYGDNQQQEQSTRFVENLCRKFNILNEQIDRLRPFEAASTMFQHSQVKYWDRIKGLKGLNDDKLTTIVLQLIKQMTTIENSNAFSIQNLITIEGRRKFEEDFVRLCIPNDYSIYQEFFKSLNDDEERVNDQILKKLNDEVDIQAESEAAKNENLYSQFRATIPMSEQQVLDYINKPGTSKFISISLQYIDSLSQIQHLLPLIEWVSYSLSRWNNKLLESTLGDQKIEEFLKAQGENKKKDKAMFTKLFDVTKAIKDLFQVDGCDTINFLEFNKETQVKYALMVKERKDSLGYILYCMIQTLCTYQNTFLEEISKIPQYSWLNEKKLQKVKFLELTKDQLINSKLDRQEILDIVQDKSYSELRYGFGKENRFIEDEITSQLEEEFIKRKVFIDFDNTVEFTFANIGSLFGQYDEIQSKIPQEKYNGVTMILQQLNNDEQISGFFQDLITAINFLSQTGGSSETTLYNYFSAFQINSFLDQIGHEPTLKYILHLFEEVEALQIPILIEQTHPKYQADIKENKFEILQQILNEIKEEAFLIKLKTLIGRLAIRHLSFTSQQTNAKESIVTYLLLDISDYLYGIQEDQIPLQDFLRNKLLKANLKLKHAYVLYQSIERRIKSIQDEIIRLQDEDLKRQNLNQQQLEADQRVKDELEDRQSMMTFQSLDEISRNQFSGRHHRQFGQEDITTSRPADKNSNPKPKKKQTLLKGKQAGPDK